MLRAIVRPPRALAGQELPLKGVMPEAFAANYRGLMRRADLSVQRFAEVYSQPIVACPARFVGYGGHGWS